MDQPKRQKEDVEVLRLALQKKEVAYSELE